MTTYTEHQLRVVAKKLREQADRTLDELKGIIDLADLLDSAAAGRTSQEELQAAVDACNTKSEDVAAAGIRMDDAFDRDDAIAWAEAAAAWLPMLPENDARAVMYALNDGLAAGAVQAMQEFADMPTASEARQ